MTIALLSIGHLMIGANLRECLLVKWYLFFLTLRQSKRLSVMYHATKKKVHVLLHPELGDTKWDRLVNSFIIILIILNVAAVMLETVPSVHDQYAEFFRVFDLVSVIIFTVEYALRVWSCNHDPRYRH